MKDFNLMQVLKIILGLVFGVIILSQLYQIKLLLMLIAGQ